MNKQAGFWGQMGWRVREDWADFVRSWQGSGESIKETLLLPGMWLLVVVCIIVFGFTAVASLVR